MKASKKDVVVSGNPFEAKWAVLAGTDRRRAAKASATSRRNIFADRRIGEDDPTVPEEDRYLARLQRERSRRNRKRARFSLSDHIAAQVGEEAAANENPLSTTQPQFSLLKDDYEEAEGLRNEAEGEGDASEDELLTIKRTAEEVEAENEEEKEGNTRHRTHQEIMSEVIYKSKMHKAKRQHDKAEGDEQTEKLDHELPNIMELLVKSDNDLVKRQTKVRKIGLESNQESLFGDENDGEKSTTGRSGGVVSSANGRSASRGGLFHYETVYQQLAAEKRARPSDRLLTEEERAEAEVQRLRELETNRKKRMHYAEDESEDETKSRSRKMSRKKRGDRDDASRTGGDDLEDDFSISMSDDSGCDDFHEGEERDQEDERYKMLEKMGGGVDEIAKKSDEALLEGDKYVCSRPFTSKQDDSDIPFVFTICPSTLEQMQILFEDKTIAQRNLVIERVLICFAVSISPATNREKLGKLLRVLLGRINILSRVSPKNVEAAVSEIDMLLVHAHALGTSHDALVSEWAKDILARRFSELTSSEDDLGLSERWDLSAVLLLRAVGRLFPSSDLRHPVSTPLAVLLSEAVSLSRLRSTQDVALAVVISSVLLEQMCESGRYSGQLALFLEEVILGSCGDSLQAPLRRHMKLYKRFAADGDKDRAISALRVSDCMESIAGRKDEEGLLEAKIVQSAMGLIEASMFSGRIPQGDIIFSRLPLRALPKTASRTQILELLVKARQERKPLTLYVKPSKATTYRMVNPKFSGEDGVYRKKPKTSYHARQSGDVTASATRVRRALRKEERGYARDVRRSAAAEGAERAREAEVRRERREKGGREVMAFMEQQQATWKKAEKRQKTMSGKKW